MAAGLQLGDDLVGDLGVKARAVGADSCGVSGHRGSPRRARKPLLRPSARHGIPFRTLTLSHGDATCTLANGIRGPCGSLCVRDGSPKGEDPRSGASEQPTARSRREAPSRHPGRQRRAPSPRGQKDGTNGARIRTSRYSSVV